jgi:hypothetical protein
LGSSCRRIGDERRRKKAKELFTGDEELRAVGNGAAAGSSRQRHAHEGREVQGVNECARVRMDSRLSFIGREGSGSGSGSGASHQWQAPLIAIKGEGLN